MIPAVRALEGEILAPGDVTVTLLDHPMAKPEVATCAAGRSVAAIAAEFAGGRTCRVTCDGRRIPPEERGGTIAMESVQIVCIPGGGAGKVFRQLAALAVTLVAAVMAPMLAAPLISSLGLGATAGKLLTAAIGVGLSVAGTLALNALFPVAQPQLAEDNSTSPTYSIGGGRNRSNPYGPIPELLGTHRISPLYAALPYTEIIGDDQYLVMMFLWGYGPMQIANLRIGETAISEYEDVEVETLQGYGTDPAPALYPLKTVEEQLSVTLEPDVDNVRTTADDADRIAIDLQAPQGLYRHQASDGNRVDRSVTIKASYRVTGTGAYTDWFDIQLSGSSPATIRKTYWLDVTRGQYDVKVVRTTALDTSDDTVAETVNWTAVRAVTNDSPIKPPAPMAVTTVRIRATSQLSNVVDTLNGDGSRLVTAWDQGQQQWLANRASSWPSDLFRHVLQGPANKKPVPDAEIDLETLTEWHAFLVANGLTYNRYHDFSSSVWETLKAICAAGRASPTFIDGKWSVIWDDPDAPVVQHFTPANSRDFKASRGYTDKIQAFRVRFIDAANSYQQDERLVFADGHNEANTTRYESLEFPGVTDRDLIWRHARYHMAQLKLRREVYEITTDFEHLACVRGSRVRLTHDVIRVGLGYGRIKAVDGDSVTLDQTVAMDVGTGYGLRFRLRDGTESLRAVATVGPVETDTLTLTADAGATAPQAGDLFAFGEYGRESTLCRVKAIRPSGDFAATLELVDDAPEIGNADKGAIPAFDPNISAPVDLYQYPPGDLQGAEFLEVVEGGLFAGLNLSWKVPPAEGVAGYFIRYRHSGTAAWTTVYQERTARTTIHNLSAGAYFVQVKAQFAGALSKWSEQKSFDVIGPYRKPPDVMTFRAVISGLNLTLSWDTISDIVFKDFEIRHSADTVNPSWSASTLLRAGTVATTLTIPYLAGSYLIRARSHLGIYSENATIVIANVMPLVDYNIVETAEDTGFGGTHSNTVTNATYGGLILDVPGATVPAEGIYTLTSQVNLAAVITARLSADVVAGGVTIGANFWDRTDFFSPADFFGTDPSAWGVRTQVRTTQDDPTASPAWSAWEDLNVGDYSARGFQFRLVLTRYSADVSPLVLSAKFTVDVPDRVVSFEDVTSGAAAYDLVFDPAFLGLKNLQVTAQDMQTGDYFTVTGKSVSGATIAFFDKDGTAISRSFDAQALGYGSAT